MNKESVSSLSRLFEQFMNGSAGLITADRSIFSKDINVLRYKELQRRVRKDLNLGYTPVNGIYWYRDEVTHEKKYQVFENSLWIPNIKDSDLRNLCFIDIPKDEYSIEDKTQQSYVYGENGKSWLKTPDGAIWGEGEQFRTQVNTKEDDYSEWKGRPFQLGKKKINMR